MKFAIKDFFSKCDQIRRKLWIWSHLQKKSLMEKFIFCAVYTEMSFSLRMNWLIVQCSNAKPVFLTKCIGAVP